MTKNTLLTFVSLAAVGAVVYLALFSGSTPEDRPAEEVSPATNAVNDSLVLAEASASGTVSVDSAKFGEPGFVVIREIIGGRPGQIVEISEYLTAGVHTDVTIDLQGEQAARGVDISGGIPVSRELAAVIYKDNGNQTFNPSEDTPAEADGEIIARFVASGDPVSESTLKPAANTDVTAADVVVVYTGEGFSPARITIQRGQTVAFVNESTRPMWVASNLHPSHEILPTFDQQDTGDTYTHTFKQAGEWEYHDHVNPNVVGTVTVE